MQTKPTIITALLLVLLSSIYSQDESMLRNYEITKIPEAPSIDGDWSDPIWQGVPITTDFVQIRPNQDDPPSFKTEVRLAYDDGALYVAAYCYDPNPDSILTQLGNRDNSLNADYFRILIDPYDQQQDFTVFQVYASGVQSEWKASDNSFNAVWESNVKIHDDGWSVEMSIPYSALRFPKKDEQQWALQFKREIRRYREEVIWAEIDINDDNFMNYWGKLTGLKNIDPPVRLSLTPFVTVQLGSKPNDDDQSEFDWLVSGGADIKYGLNESFTLDMTLLPDFSQVLPDNIVNNLGAFEVVFDEQRSFFQEGIDLFNKGDLFYSRRIGGRILDGDAAEDALIDGEEIVKQPEISKLLNALKVSGRTKKGSGIGVFNAIEGRSFALLEASNGDNRKVRTDPFTNYNITVLEKNWANNRSIYAINTSVIRTDDFDNANVSGVGADLNVLDNKFNIEADVSYSLVNEKDGSDNRKQGLRYEVGMDKIKGRFRYGFESGGITENYDINDLSVNFRTNFLWNEFAISHDINEPVGRLRNLGNWAQISFRNTLSNGQLEAIFLNTNHWMTFEDKFLTIWFGAEATLTELKDYYEPRADDRVYNEYPWGGVYFGFSTDYRKKLAFDFNMWQGVSARFDGIYHHNYRLMPIWRVNDHLTMNHEIRFAFRNKDIGYVDEIDEIIFGSRNSRDVINTFTANYIFKNNLSLIVRARHYWNRVVYHAYYDLNQTGDLDESIYYTDPNKENDESFNTFNIDVLFNWQFAPGSTLSISYKHSLFDSTNEIPHNFFKNFGQMYEAPQSNVISIRALYFLDYVIVRSWVQNGRNKRAGNHGQNVPKMNSN